MKVELKLSVTVKYLAGALEEDVKIMGISCICRLHE